jgi:hypothetical protein
MNQTTTYDIASVMAAVRGTGLMRSLATFQNQTGGTGPTGFPLNTYTPVAGLINIACMDAPLGTGEGFSVDEGKAQPQILAHGERHILLDSYYPAAVDVWRNGGNIVIDGTAYDLLGVESDSQRTQTRVRAQVATI